MTEIEKLYEKIADGPAGTLLVIADANDENKALFRNNALSIAMEFAAQLHYNFRQADNRKVMQLLGADKIPPDFITLTALFLRAISDKSNAQYAKVSRDSDSDEVSLFVNDYESFVYRALSETFADVMWQDRKGKITGPDYEQCASSYSIQDLGIIWQIIVRYYISNILIHYFEGTRVRMDNKTLPEEVEESFREQDAAILSAYIFNGLQFNGNVQQDVATVQKKAEDVTKDVVYRTKLKNRKY